MPRSQKLDELFSVFAPAKRLQLPKGDESCEAKVSNDNLAKTVSRTAFMNTTLLFRLGWSPLRLRLMEGARPLPLPPTPPTPRL